MFWWTKFVQLFVSQTLKLLFIPLHMMSAQRDGHGQLSSTEGCTANHTESQENTRLYKNHNFMCVEGVNKDDKESSYCCVNAAEKDVYFQLGGIWVLTIRRTLLKQ